MWEGKAEEKVSQSRESSGSQEGADRGQTLAALPQRHPLSGSTRFCSGLSPELYDAVF